MASRAVPPECDIFQNTVAIEPADIHIGIAGKPLEALLLRPESAVGGKHVAGYKHSEYRKDIQR